MRLQHCNVGSFVVVYPHTPPNGVETWAAKGHACSYDWEGRAWSAKKIAPGDWVKVMTSDFSAGGLSRGKGCRPEGMVIAVVDNDYLILWSGDAHVDPRLV